MKFNIKYFFNLIEVTLAIGILAMGATAVLALFPLGIERNRDSIGENYCSDAACDIVAYIKATASAESGFINDWRNNFIATLPIVQPDLSGDPSITSFADWVNVGANDEYDVYEIGGVGNDGIYGLKKEANGIVEFAGKAAIWYEQIGSISTDIAIGIHIEINWPVARRYLLRKKNYYYVEVYNNNYGN
jgi:hypothetical protein